MPLGKVTTKAVRVADWMTESVLAVETFDSIGTARQLMAKHRINQLPVLENDSLVGIVTDRDIRDAYPTSMLIGRPKEIDAFAQSYTVEEVMTHDIFTDHPERYFGFRLKRHGKEGTERSPKAGQKAPPSCAEQVDPYLMNKSATRHWKVRLASCLRSSQVTSALSPPSGPRKRVGT